ncbi:YmfL family putative regulatory protein [Pseudomonas chlororaphis]|uniref:YmfL family putative regulatory protein n=1 Tax=Pseudomonas chlororaphis TaxID=587753 RepID=UPI002367E955|nr:YmfL family putative regulatory protein [Pseudomonas chlororaphis]WDG45685.1 YmfL family putative regulatory protein [Pseudomonas chlororaphis]
MKSPVLETRRAAVIAAANAISGGLPCAAAFLGEDFKRFKNRIYESAGVKPLTDDEVCVLETESQTTFLPDYLCAMYGGVFVRLPDSEALDNVDMHHRSLRTAVKRGRVDQMIALALEDGEIDAAEAKEILALHAKHMAARHEEVNAVIELHKARA